MKLLGKLKELFRARRKPKRHTARAKTYRFSEFETTVNRMSNWQRSKWAQAGYPGLPKKEVDKVQSYLTMMKPPKNVFVALGRSLAS